jgi:CheY-like chemotaxis protein
MVPGVAPKILLVDDNQELLTLLARLVEAEGWTPVTVNRGKAALDAIATERPAAAVVDVLLPDMMGYDVAHGLRNALVPFVFMTGVFKGGRAANDARGQHGAAGYFEKPFEARKLIEALRQLLPAQVAPPARAPAPSFPPRAAEVPEASDFDVEFAVEADEPVEAMDLTGRVVLTEDGKVSAVLRGATVHAAPIGAPARPPPRAAPPPPRAADARQRPPAPGVVAVGGVSKPAGRLEDNLPDLINAFYLAQQTGELTLQKGKVKKTIYFENGRPCFAISNLVTDRFGPFLVRVGKITLAQLELCQAAADKTGRRTGDILVEMKLLKDTEKLYYVAQQVKAIAYSAFGWEEGEYRMHFTDRAASEAIKIDLHPANLITRGVKKLYKPERLFRLLAADDVLVPSPQPGYGLGEVELERWEAELFPHVDGRRSVSQLVELGRQPEPAVYAFLYGMLALKIVERARP